MAKIKSDFQAFSGMLKIIVSVRVILQNYWLMKDLRYVPYY